MSSTSLLKKIGISLIVISTILQNTTKPANANSEGLEGVHKTKKEKVLSFSNGEKIIQRINSYIKKREYSPEELVKLEERVNKIKNKYGLDKQENIKKYEKINSILGYITVSIKLKGKEEKAFQKISVIKKIPTPVVVKVEPDYSNQLNKNDTDEINSKIRKIQDGISQKGVKHIEKIISQFNEYTNYEEKGNIEVTVKANIGEKEIQKVEANFGLKDYTIKNSGFDSKINTNLHAFVRLYKQNSGKKEILKLKAFIDYILKDQNYYLLIKDLKIDNTIKSDQLKIILEKLEGIEQMKKYLHFKNSNAELLKYYAKELNIDNLILLGKTITNRPLVRAYKKSKNRYYIVPTKYSCQLMLQRLSSPCTQEEYNNLLQTVKDSKVEYYIEISKNKTTVGFINDTTEGELEVINGNITFVGDSIDEINFKLIPSQDKYKDQGIKFHYKKRKGINGYIKIDDNYVKVNIILKSKLDKNNRFNAIDFSAKVNKELLVTLSLRENILSGKYNIGKDSGKLKVKGIVSGKTNKTNKIIDINIKNQIIFFDKYLVFENLSTLNYNSYALVLQNNYISKNIKSLLSLNIEKRSNSLSEGEFNLNIEERENKKYNKKTQHLTHSKKFKEIFNSNIKLKNGIFSGKSIVKKQSNKVIVKIIHSGEYTKNFCSFNNKIELEAILNPLNQGKKTFLNTGVSIDNKRADTKLNFYINAFTGEKSIFDIMVKQNARKIYKKINIKSPSNTVDIHKY